MGGIAKIPVHVARRAGFQGPVELKVLGLPEGFRAEPLGATAQDGKVVLTVVDERPPDRVPRNSHLSFAVKVEGTGQIEKKEIRTLAQTPYFLAADGPGYVEAPRVSAFIAFVEPPSFQLTLEKQFPGSLSLGSEQQYQAELHVRIQRDPRFIGDLSFRPVSFPSGVEIQSVEMARDRDSAILKLVAHPDKAGKESTRVTIQAVATEEATEVVESLPGFYLEVR